MHAAAQQKLIDSFPEIAKDEHSLIYTTHSHYMVEPKWLEQTYIVTNYADSPLANSTLDGVSLDDESLDVKATSYRSFVNANPTSTSYFQPIMGRLEVVPSRFDIQRSSVILEGKSDYYILRYALQLLAKSDLSLLPGLGAGTFGALIALHLGWGLEYIFLLDSDKQGRVERKRYINEYGVNPKRIVKLDDFDPKATEIEKILDATAVAKIRSALKLTSQPTKGQILRYFQESLVSNTINDLGPSFRTSSEAIIEGLRNRLNSP